MSHFHLITTSARSTLYRPKLSASLVASCAQLCLHKHSSLKMPHRGIFFTVGFKSLRAGQKKTPRRVSFFGLPEGTWTPILRNRNPLRYPIAPRADVCGRVFCLPFFIFNSHNLLSDNQLQKLLCNSLELILCGYYTTIFYFKQGKFVAPPDCNFINCRVWFCCKLCPCIKCKPCCWHSYSPIEYAHR